MIRHVLLLALLMTAPLAVAQSGPAPGHDDAIDYAADYAQDQGGAAAADPVGYATSKGSAAAAGEEAGHAAYVACWAVDDATGMDPAGVCEPFYTPPGEVDAPEPEAEPKADASAGAPEEVDAAMENATALADEALDGVEEIVEDPSRAPGVLARLADAIVAFVTTTLSEMTDKLGLAVDAGATGVAGTWRLSLGARTFVVDALDAAVAWDLAAYEKAGRSVAVGARTGGGAIGDGAAAVGRGIVDGAVAAGGGVSAAARGVGDAGATAGRSVADAATAAGRAVAGAADAAAEGVAGLWSSWFGDGASEAVAPEPVDTETVPEAEGLVDGVLDVAGSVAAQ